jgi:hypothetical protein
MRFLPVTRYVAWTEFGFFAFCCWWKSKSMHLAELTGTPRARDKSLYVTWLRLACGAPSGEPWTAYRLVLGEHARGEVVSALLLDHGDVDACLLAR